MHRQHRPTSHKPSNPGAYKDTSFWSVAQTVEKTWSQTATWNIKYLPLCERCVILSHGKWLIIISCYGIHEICYIIICYVNNFLFVCVQYLCHMWQNVFQAFGFLEHFGLVFCRTLLGKYISMDMLQQEPLSFAVLEQKYCQLVTAGDRWRLIP